MYPVRSTTKLRNYLIGYLFFRGKSLNFPSKSISNNIKSDDFSIFVCLRKKTAQIDPMPKINMRNTALAIAGAYLLLMLFRWLLTGHIRHWVPNRETYGFGYIFSLFAFYLLVFISFLYLLAVLITINQRSFKISLLYYIIGGFPFLYFCGKLLIRILKTIYSTLF